jgi:hypothetical protein
MRLRTFAAVIVLLSITGYARAERSTVLTPGGTLYAIDGSSEVSSLELERRSGNESKSKSILVPTTDDAAMESQAQLLWDGATSTVFLAWHRSADGIDEIRLAALRADESWSEPVVVASGARARRVGLQAVLTHAPAGNAEGDVATLVHFAWWNIAAAPQVAQFALVAFEKGALVSVDESDLDALVQLSDSGRGGDGMENVGTPLHPPLAMVQAKNGVDIVYGLSGSTSLTRVHLDPRRISPEARIWRPIPRMGGHIGPARLVSADGSAVQAFLSKGRIVLYTPGVQFRFVVFDNGLWSPLRMIQLDENVTVENVVDELHRSIDGLAIEDTAGQ